MKAKQIMMVTAYNSIFNATQFNKYTKIRFDHLTCLELNGRLFSWLTLLLSQSDSGYCWFPNKGWLYGTQSWFGSLRANSVVQYTVY